MWFLILLTAAAVLLLAVYYYKTRSVVCKCGLRQWAKYTDVSPAGDNPLNLRISMQTWYCRHDGYLTFQYNYII